MQYYALCSRSRFRNVHLLLDDIPVVAGEGDERCLGGPVRECTELRSTFQNYTTVISSMEIYANNCIVLINGMMKIRRRRRTRN